MDIVINKNEPFPVYAQLIDQVKKAFFSGKLRGGSALPSVRQLANDLDISYEAVAKAYSLLERDAVIKSKRCGIFVHPDELRRKERASLQELENEIRDARDILMSLLPGMPPSLDGADISGICIPAKQVGGDYYNYVSLQQDNGKFGIVLADVAGHGMRAAAVAIRFSEILRYESKGRGSANEILAGMDVALKDKAHPGMFVTCGMAVLDTSENSLCFTSAGNPEAYHFRSETCEVLPLGVKGIPLGTVFDLAGMEPFGSTKRNLAAGDYVILISDGIEEAQNSAKDFYGPGRLMSVIAKHAREDATAEALRDAIIADVRRFQGEMPQEDDMTVVILHIE